MLLSRNLSANCIVVSSPVALTDWREKNEDFNKQYGNNSPGVNNNP